MNLFSAIAVVLVATTCNAQGSLKDILTGGSKIVVGTGQQITDFIPTPKYIFESGKDVLAGLPFAVALKAIHEFCSAALYAESIVPRITPNINAMSFILMKPGGKKYEFPLLEPKKLIESEYFNPDGKVVVFITGWKTDMSEKREDVAAITEAYLCRNDTTNLIVLDSARFIDTLYTWSAYNTEQIGEHLGEALAELGKVVPVSNIHVIGHSLGAQIAGASGRYYNYKTDNLLPRITGLDPANPCFNDGGTLTGLGRGDAVFVDVIHSNNGALGKREPVGDADFYPGGVTVLQPGSIGISSSHMRAVHYYAESVKPGYEENFMAVKCPSLYKLNAGKCKGIPVPMGYAAPTNLIGNYMLDVDPNEPYGKNSKGFRTKC